MQLEGKIALVTGASRGIGKAIAVALAAAGADVAVNYAGNKAAAEAVAAKLEGVSLTIATKVSSTGTIFGSVGNIQIAEALSKLGHEVDRKIIVVKDAVKEVGAYKAIVKLHKEVSVEIPFEVVAE